jgi:TfoX/Sxy family transcriptional regulator of competence genes
LKFEKLDPVAVEKFNSIAPGKGQGVEERKMFGYPCRFLNGNMFLALHNNGVILRLSEADRANISKHGARPFEPMPGRVMKEYVALPEDMFSRQRLKPWIEKSLDYASSLAPKAKKSAKPRRA